MSARTEAVLGLSREWFEVFVGKEADYGSSYILTGKTLQLWFPEGVLLDSPLKQVYVGLLTRMLDKLIRASNLVLRGLVAQVQDEKAYVTMGDLGVYGFMTAEVLKNGV